jgi:hypothetical protein
MSQVNTELGRSSSATISLGESAVRSLAGVPSGAISFQNLRGKSAMSVSAPNVEELRGGFDNFGTVTGSTTATVTGGTSPFTFAWTRLSGDFPNISSLSVQNPTFSATVFDGATNSSTWRVTVTDANSNTATANITVDLYYFNISN